MANPAKDMTGLQFGYLTVLQREGSIRRPDSNSAQATWLCRCACGNEVVRSGVVLRAPSRGPLKSCGCRRGEMLVEAWGSHGMTGHPAWVTWSQMRARCLHPGNKDWHNYGGRGIKVCKRWAESFAAFWEDMGPTWQEGLTIDRRRVNGHYTPKNCRWATAKEQANNTRSNIRIKTPKGVMTVAQAAEAFGLKRITLYKRLGWGWPLKKALVPPGSTTS